MNRNRLTRAHVVERIGIWRRGNRDDSSTPDTLNFANALSDKLLETGAIIAGGAPLAIIHNERPNDLDIYIRLSQAKKITDFILRNTSFYVKARPHTAPAYDQSFFRKNRILERIGFSVIDQTSGWESRSIDVMIVPDDVDPKQVASNFDLTFCEIWYDGNSIDGVDLEGSFQKTGRVRDEYLDSLLKHFNKFIIKRMVKYNEKGYQIKYHCNGRYDVQKPTKKVTSPEEWVVTKIYKELMDCITDRPFLIKWTLNYPLLNYSMEDIREPTKSMMELLRLDMDAPDFLRGLMYPMLKGLKEPYLTYMMTTMDYTPASEAMYEQLSEQIGSAIKRLEERLRSETRISDDPEAVAAAQERMLARQATDREALERAARRIQNMNIQQGRQTIWQQLCALPTLSEANAEKLRTTRNQMNRVLIESTGRPMIRTDDVCQDLADIVDSYNEWFNEMLPGCSNSTNFLEEPINELGFGELIVIPFPNNPNRYNCFSAEELQGIAANTENPRNPYNNVPLPQYLIDRASNFARILSSYYEGGYGNSTDTPAVERLENLLREAFPYITNLEEALQLQTPIQIQAQAEDNEILGRTMIDEDLQEEPENRNDLVENLLLPLAEIEDDLTTTRRLNLVGILYPALRAQLFGEN